MQVIVIDNTKVLNNGLAVSTKNSHVAWENLLIDATVTSTVDTGKLSALYDYSTTVYWNAGVGAVEVDIVLPSSQNVNCFGIAGGNWATADTTIEFYSDAGVTLAGSVTGLNDGQPYMLVFDTVQTDTLKVRFTSVGDLFVGELLAGLTLEFPCAPSLGLQLAQWNNTDKVVGNVTENNGIVSGIVVQQPRRTIAPYSLVPVSWMNSIWENFINAHRGKPIFYGWNVKDNPTQIIYGQWSQNSPRYTKSVQSEVTLTIEGQI